jgi:3-dehydroquinate dehydratase-1
MDQIKKIFSLPHRLVATYRPGQVSNIQRERILSAAIESGATYVDIEIESNQPFKKRIKKICADNDCKLILSYHNYKCTPIRKELENIITTSIVEGADIAKIACLVQSAQDNAEILSLYKNPDLEGKIIAIGMGEKGKITRVAASFMGAPFTYAAINPEMETAPGQLDSKTLKEIIRKIKE